MLLLPMIRDWARHLIAYEAAADASSVQTEPAAFLVYEKLRRQLCVPMGVDGFQVLASRALTLAKAEAPRLNAVEITAEGCLRGLGELESQAGPDQEGDAGAILIAHLLALFMTFLGVATMCQLVQDVFPHLGSVTGSETSMPFENILQEVDHLRNVSKHLETMAIQHPALEDGLVSISGNIRDIAAILDVFAVIREKSVGRRESEPKLHVTGYVM